MRFPPWLPRLACALLLASLGLVAFAADAPAPAVEARVTSVVLDDSRPPIIAEVEVELVNHTAQTLHECEFVLRYLDAKGKALMERKHAVTAIDLAPGKDMIASFQDFDPPKRWAETVEVGVACR